MIKKKSIVIFREYIGNGGIESQIRELTKALLENGWDVCFVSDMESPLSDAVARTGARVFLLKKKSLWGKALELRGICGQQGASILQAHMFRESIICRVVKMMMPRLICVFRVHTYIDCSYIPLIKKNMYHLLAWLTDPWVNKYLSINEYNVCEMIGRSRLRKRKIVVIPDAVKEAVSSFDATAEYQAESRRDRLVMIANFVYGKGHDVLLDGVKILRDQGHDVKVRLIGGVSGIGTDHANEYWLNIIRETIRKYELEDVVEIYGVSSNIPDAIQDCGIVVLPSYMEGTPNVLLEAMWLRKLVIASSVGGVPEFVFPMKTGFLHRARDPEDLAETVIQALKMSNDEYIRIVEAAHKLIAEKFLIGQIIKQFCEVYNGLLGLE